MNLPFHPNLPVRLLAACFNKTSATYKFYWFLSLLERVEAGETIIDKQHLFAGMIAQAWYTVNYFHVSFGKQDQLQQAIGVVRQQEGLTIDADRAQITGRLAASTNKTTLKTLRYFNTEVPHRFLSPWFRADDLKQAYAQSETFTNNCLYALSADTVSINPSWAAYLKENAGILKDFCYWNLAVYLQSKNPNVPDIPNKLIRSPLRRGLSEQRKHFWDVVIAELGSVDCIYSNSRLTVGAYAVEHFLPYAFVSHDLIWNLIPADRSFNSSKSDKLPVLETHFEPFFRLQQQAVEIVGQRSPQNKFLQDYLTIFPALDEASFTRQKFLEQLQPLVRIAANNGFEFLRS